MSIFRGIFVANLTPFKEASLEIDWEVLEAHVRELASVPRLGGIVCNAHAGEGELLTREEKKEVIRRVVSICNGKLPVVAGVYSVSLPEVLAQLHDAEDAGASAVMVCAPPLFAWNASVTPEVGIRFMQAIAAEAKVPLVLFQYSPNNPFTYQVKDVIKMLDTIPQIKAIKMATNLLVDRYEYEYKAIKAVHPEIALLPASGLTMFYAFQIGADGGLSGSANFAPEEDIAIFELIKAGEIERAKEIHDKVYPLMRAVYKHPYAFMHERYKYVTYMLGKIPNPVVRPPLIPLPKDEIEGLQSAIEASGLKVVNRM